AGLVDRDDARRLARLRRRRDEADALGLHARDEGRVDLVDLKLLRVSAVALLMVELRDDAIAELLVRERPREEHDETEQIEDRIAELRPEPPEALLPLVHHFVPFASSADPSGAGVLAGALRSKAETPISTGPYESA